MDPKIAKKNAETAEKMRFWGKEIAVGTFSFPENRKGKRRQTKPNDHGSDVQSTKCGFLTTYCDI